MATKEKEHRGVQRRHRKPSLEILTPMSCTHYDLAIKDEEQIAFYDPGVGTGGWEYDESTLGLKSLADQATGHGLQKNVEDAYRYLMTCYEKGDHIYLFGFSRGAFTARSLAGMLYKVGLLRKGHENLLEYASKLYNTSPDPHNDEVAADFKNTFSRSCPIYFIGVWDTVDSRVMNAGKRFADPTLNPDISFAYHALAIDEHRKDFPALPLDGETDRGADGRAGLVRWGPCRYWWRV